MGLYTSLVSSLLFPLHERIKRHDSVKVRKQMERDEWLSAEQLRATQVRRLRDFLVDAGSNVPYYHDLFQSSGFDPAAVTDLQDLQRLPFLVKSLIRANADAMKHVKGTGLTRYNTGGSSGEPLIFFVGKKRVTHDVAAKWRATRWWGVDIGDPEVVVWGSPIELGKQDIVKRWRDYLFRTRLLPAFEMSESKLDQFIADIRSTRPRMLFGYPSALSLIDRHAQVRGIVLDQLGIKVAFVTSERLYDDQRYLIETVFGCPVANGYGGRDAGFIAPQCPAGGMHITADDLIGEIVNETGEVEPAGITGEIVVKHLATKQFPFFRYWKGDTRWFLPEKCACGRSLPLIKEIQGRSTDFVVAADGTVMHGLALIYILRDMPGVKSFKVVQESLELTRILLVTDATFTVESERNLVDGFKGRLGSGVQICVEQCDEIPVEKSGKFRYIVSHVAGTARS